MWSGFTGDGAKTVIPAKAHAKISMRLVPDQDPDEIARLFEEYVAGADRCGMGLERMLGSEWRFHRGFGAFSLFIGIVLFLLLFGQTFLPYDLYFFLFKCAQPALVNHFSA